ncbi:MAG: hypothetical protein AB1483_12265 [Candidatus Zixiibacteriota bacterium]
MGDCSRLIHKAVLLSLILFSLFLGCSDDNGVEPELEEMIVWPQTITKTVQVGGSLIVNVSLDR